MTRAYCEPRIPIERLACSYELRSHMAFPPYCGFSPASPRSRGRDADIGCVATLQADQDSLLR